MKRAGVLAALLLVTGQALAQASPDEQAQGLLEDGRAYWLKQQYKQALDNFNTIVSGFQQTDSVDDAWLEIGRYHLEVENDPAKAREAFDRVAKSYPQSDGAPGAYYYLGLLTMNRALAPAEIDDALAQFGRVQRLYPRSDWVPRALYASGLAQRKAGRYAEAVEAERRVSLEHPTSDVAAAAQFQIGHCLALQGEFRQAMEGFQHVRNRFPESSWAGLALLRTTALYRLFGGDKPVFGLDVAYAPASGDLLKDVGAILMTPERTLWIASDKVKSAVPIGLDGTRGASLSGEDLRTLTLSPRNEVVLAARSAVRVGARDIKSFAAPGDKPGELEVLDRIQAAAVTQAGSILIADGKHKRVLRYDTAFEWKGAFLDARPREIRRILQDGEGGIALLDTDEKSVRVYDEAGKLLRSIVARGAGYELKKPLDVAIDPFRNTYVADADGGVYVFNPAGALLLTLSTPELRRPSALTLDGDGAVIAYDEKAERIVRFK